ncbi:putative spermidine/putrescine transport system permease protein [Halarchaeum solikamskense]|uniref:ABC transporter permease n=1 Tax=Halarchaeum nitratireducens TaxID=489913 RepID=UPI001B3B195B|nr:ABC transporter permease [Halarchaeum solikamskense]MBP2252498.1 putative spermidine/putrescine transport system permease protein [Halarchaeum solikamskense]
MATASEEDDGSRLSAGVGTVADWAYRLLVYGVLLFTVAPLVVVVLLSFRPNPYGNSVFSAGWPSATWYANLPDLLASLGFASSLIASLKIAVVTTILSLLIGGLAAYAIVRKEFSYSSLLETVLISPLVYPWLLMSLAILMTASYLSGAFDVRISMSFWTLLAGHVLFTFPYPIRTIGAGLQNYDDELDEAARNLGATRLDTVWNVTLPLLRPGIISGAAFVFILSFNQYIISLFLSGTSIQTVPLLMFNLIKAQSPPQIAVLGTMLMAGMVALTIVVEYVAGMSRYI